MNRLLVLRPEPGASATVERARQRGLDAVAVPLFVIEAVAWDAPDSGSFDALLLTSANALRADREQLRSLRRLPVYAVGEATAEAAREAGFDIAATGDQGIDRLLSSVEGDLKLLHLCGANRREPDEAAQSITSIIVYRARAIESPDLGDLKGCIALVHSPRAGSRFAKLIDDRSNIAIAAISPAAAEAVGTGWRAVEASAQPNDDTLLALAERLCNNLAR